MYALMVFCAVTSSVLTLFWIFLFFRYRNRYDTVLEEADGKIFTLKDLYFLGLGLIEIFERTTNKKITTSDKAILEIKNLTGVFGREKAELYYYIECSASVSLFLTFLPLGLLFPCLTRSTLGFFCGVVLAILFPYSVNSSIKSAVQRMKYEIISEFPKMVSKLTLLINAGMLVRRAWDEVAESNYDEKLYAEMRITSKDIQEGMSIEAAMDNFASRCGLREIRKFASIYVQAVKRGASDSIDSMKVMADEAWMQKKQLSKQAGEKAAQQLLLPNMIMFIGIILVVVVPMCVSAFSGL